MSGTITDYCGNRVIQSLTFYTNQRTIGPFGYTDGSDFKLPIEDGEIVGFFGRAGEYLDGIGVYVKPSSHWGNDEIMIQFE